MYGVGTCRSSDAMSIGTGGGPGGTGKAQGHRMAAARSGFDGLRTGAGASRTGSHVFHPYIVSGQTSAVTVPVVRMTTRYV